MHEHRACRRIGYLLALKNKRPYDISLEHNRLNTLQGMWTYQRHLVNDKTLFRTSDSLIKYRKPPDGLLVHVLMSPLSVCAE